MIYSASICINIFRDLKDFDIRIIRRSIPQLLAFTHPTNIDYNVTELMYLEKVLEYNDYTTPVAYMRRITINCNELLIKCKWNAEEIDCMRLFTMSYTTDGLCCSFNQNNGLV